jgi:hypothetical protein
MAGVALDTLLLMIDELAANAVRHGRTAFQVRLYLPCAGCLRVEVFDANAALPEPREADEDAEAGRGLLLIACMSERWGYVLAPPGKIVYADVLLAA